MKTAMVFRADGKLQAIFKIDDEEKFKLACKAAYNFPFYVEILDDIPTLSSMMSITMKENEVELHMKDAYTNTNTLQLKDEVVTCDDYIVCTEAKLKSMFEKNC
jgi:hypothetical protein